LKGLRNLRLDGNKLSDEEKQRAKDLLPRCHIMF